MTVGRIPIFGSRRSGVFATIVRRVVAALLVGAGAAALLALSHLARPKSAHQADDKEEQCRLIQETYEESEGELAKCQAELSYLRAVERKR